MRLSAKNLTHALLILFFVLSLGLSVYSMSLGLGHPISSHHQFRKAQTAITAYYQARDGLSLNYETPVLGAPWSIPMEFPLYQWCVAGVVRLSGLPLEPAGRVISMVFFGLGLLALFHLFRNLGASRAESLVPVSLVLLSPIYIYWSRCLMIESTAWCFCLAWLAGLARLQSGQLRAWRLALTLLWGILGALIKITTFAVCSAPAAIAFAFILLRQARTGGLAALLRRCLPWLLAFLVPILAAAAWTFYADAVKARNPLAYFLLSQKLTLWNFGTLSQRLSPEFWQWITENSSKHILGSPWILLLLPALTLNRECARYAGLALLGFLAGPLVFTNLYDVHDYYFYANSFFMLALPAFSLLALLRRPRLALPTSALVLPLVLGLTFYGYTRSYMPEQVRRDEIFSPSLFLKAVTEKDDVLIVLGQDWDPYTAYYAERRAIMPRKLALTDPRVVRSIEITGKDRIAALLARAPNPLLNKWFDLYPEALFPNVWLRRDIYQQALLRLFSVDVTRSVLSAPFRVFVKDERYCLLAVPPSLAVLPLSKPGSQLRISYGIADAVGSASLQPTLFSVNHVAENGTSTRLLENAINPQTSPGAREVKGALLELQGLGPGHLQLCTEGTGSAAYWADIAVQ